MTLPTYEISYDRDSADFRVDFATSLPSLWRPTWADADDAARSALASQRKAAANLAAGELAQANAAVAAAVAGYEPAAEEWAELAAWVAELEAEEATTTTPTAPVAYTLPPAALVREALAELARTAQAAGDTANANALNKAAYQAAEGVYGFVRVDADGALLVPSRTAAGAVYRVGEAGCSCLAGSHGRACWHSAISEGIALARDVVAAELDEEAEHPRPLALAA